MHLVFKFHKLLLLMVLAGWVSFFGIASPALAQGFMVKPMKMEVTVPAGRTATIPLEIRNTAGSETRKINLRLAELSQNPDGGWKLVEVSEEESSPKSQSSLAWTELSDDEVDIAPLAPSVINVILDVPPDARGAYFAAIIAEQPAPENTTGVFVRVRFVIPVIIQIEGRPARQEVELVDVKLLYENAAERTATTLAGLHVQNKGRTFSQIKADLTVEKQVGDGWRSVTRLDLKERGIMPGMTLDLGEDLKRRLPSGLYRLRGELKVDGRRVPSMRKEIQFEGDANAQNLAYDTALVLKPAIVDVEAVPGSTRTTTVSLENPGTQPIVVDVSTVTPPSLIGVAMGEVTGMDFSAEPWTKAVPSRLSIRPGSRQNVRVISALPRNGAEQPSYYAGLVFSAKYEDGQSAGETHSMVRVSNKGAARRAAGIVENVSIAQGEGTKYFVQARLVNVGNVDVRPIAKASLTTSRGRTIREVDLTGEEDPLLPLGMRVLGAELNLSGVEPGYYALRVRFDLPEGAVDPTEQQILEIAVDTSDAKGGENPTFIVKVVDSEKFESEQLEDVQPEGISDETENEKAG